MAENDSHKTAEERAEWMYPESETTYGYGAVREAFEAGAHWATNGEPSAVTAPEQGEDARAHALHDAFWAVHAGRFHGREAGHGVDTFYAGTNAAKRAIETLHGSAILRPWPAVTEQGKGRADGER